MKRAAKAIFAAVLAAFSFTLPAAAQQPGFPQLMPPNTVYGRSGISTGPGQAIPFSVIIQTLNNTTNNWAAPQNFSGGIASTLPAATLTQGIDIAFQPAGAVTSAQQCGGTLLSNWYSLNCITATNWNVNAGAPGQVMNFTINSEINGTSAQAGLTMFGLASNVQFIKDAGVTDRSSYSAIIGVVDVQQSPTVASDFGVFAMNCNAGMVGGIVWPTNSQMVCFEADLTVASAGLQGRTLLKLISSEPLGASNVQATSWDAYIYAQSVPGQTPFGMKNFILLDGSFGKLIATNGCIICTTAGAITVTTGIDWSTWTFTGNQLKGTGITIDGLGNTTALSLTAANFAESGSSSGLISFKTQAAAGTFNWNWPITAGSAGNVLASGGGGAAPMTWINGVTTVCTITAGNSYTFTNGVLTTKGANCT